MGIITPIILKNKKLLIYLSLVLFINIVKFSPFLYNLYYQHFYLNYSLLLRKLMSNFYFSVGDILYLILLLATICYILFVVVFIFFTSNRLNYLKYEIKRIIKTLLLIYIIFMFCWGLNFSNKNFTNSLNLKPVLNYSLNDLLKLKKELIILLNELREKISQDEINNLNNLDIIELTKSDIVEFKNINPAYYLVCPVLKPSLFPEIVNLLGFSGYINPFTGEGNIRLDNPVLLTPLICIHEYCHQLGIPSEEQTSAISLIICLNSNNNIIKYSALLDVYFYLISEINYLSNQNSNFNFGYLLNSSNVYDKYLNPFLTAKVKYDLKITIDKITKSKTRLVKKLNTIFRGMYSNFLKLNNQTAGIRSYNVIIPWFIGFIEKQKQKKPQ